jgi:hypothetical protein
VGIFSAYWLVRAALLATVKEVDYSTYSFLGAIALFIFFAGCGTFSFLL